MELDPQVGSVERGINESQSETKHKWIKYEFLPSLFTSCLLNFHHRNASLLAPELLAYVPKCAMLISERTVSLVMPLLMGEQGLHHSLLSQRHQHCPTTQVLPVQSSRWETEKSEQKMVNLFCYWIDPK